MAKILIVDDEPRIRDLIREHLQYAGFVCEEAGDGGAEREPPRMVAEHRKPQPTKNIQNLANPLPTRYNKINKERQVTNKNAPRYRH